MKTKLFPVLCLLLFPALLAAQELEAIPADLARGLATQFVEQVNKFDKPAAKIDGDLEKVNGVHIPHKMGLLIVPQSDLKESEELDKKFESKPGASLAILFAYHVIPVVDGKKVDANKLYTVTVKDDEGKEHPLYALLLVVHKPTPDDYRLHAYGKDAKPVVDAKFAEGTGPGPVPVAVELKDINKETREGNVVVTAFGKYQASFKAAYEGE